MKKPTLVEMLKFSIYLGTIGYGGPAILVQMKNLMLKKGWIVEKEFMNALSLAQILPGATGVSIMAYFGYKFHKLYGAVIMVLGFLFSPTIAILLLSYIYFKFGNLGFIRSIMTGLGALVVALLINATVLMIKGQFKKLDTSNFKAIIISIITFLGIFIFKINVIYLILFSGLLAIMLFYFTKNFEDEKFKGKEIKEIKEINKTIKNFHFSNLLILLIIIILIGTILFSKELEQIFLTFFKIGIFAFGGGFTTIPLIQHQVVESLHWINLKEFSDGIALGQITPGPVFITATFIGYKVYGILGALTATIAIFLPSIIAMLGLSSIHAKVKEMKIIKVIIKGFLAGFIGLLLAVTLQFELKGIVNWQTLFVCISSLIIIMVLRKDVLWAIAFTIFFSLIFI